MDIDLVTLNNDLKEKGIYKIPDFIHKSKLILLNKEFDDAINNTHIGIKITPYSLGNCARINANNFDRSKFPETTELFYSFEED